MSKMYTISDLANDIELVDPKSKKPTRVGYDVTGGKKVRIARKSNNQV